MPMAKIGVREFREGLAAIMAEEKAVAVTRHGETIGLYIPVRRKRQVDWAKLDALKAQIDQQLAELGVTEDELLEDFKRARKTRRSA